MKVEELLLGREREVAVAGGKKLRARQLPGTDIFVAPDGSFVMPRWSEVEVGTTPRQRARKKWRPEELGYVVYPQGLFSAARGRQLALLQARVVSCPTYQAALKVFLEEVRSAIISKEGADLQSLSPALRQKLQAFGYVFQRAQKIGTQEAMVKIRFLYQDEAGNLNVGAMLARTVAITDRLRERLLGMYSWTRKYQAQERALKMVQSMAQSTIDQAAKHMEALARGAAKFRGRKAQQLISDRLATLSMSLEPLKLIQPFSRWMAFVMKDFNEMLAAVRGEDYVLARILLERVIFSVRLKKAQVSLDRLLLRVGQDAVIKRLAWNDYAAWTVNLAMQFQSCSAIEKNVGFREAVCQKAGRALYEASKEASTRRRLRHFKAAIKRAYAIL